MMSPEEIYEIAQALIDRLEKEIGTIQARIEGIALLYSEIAEADGRKQQQQRDLDSITTQEEEPASTAGEQALGTESSGA